MTSEAPVKQEEIDRIFAGFTLEAQKQISDQLDKRKKRVIILSGPTACGKSELSTLLAETINGEVVSADSIQVYRNMDIGTAKVTKEQCRDVPHHLIDIRDVHEPFNVVDFYFEARNCCRQILDREAIPIITGGSGFYIHSLIYGPPSGPPSVPEVRDRLEKEMEHLGPDHLYKKLRQLDLVYANSITKRDKQKIIRGLEIIALTGKRVSELSWKARYKPQNFDFRCWFLYRPKEKLYERVEKRCDEMLEAGFLDEVRELEKQGLRENSSAAQAIGYRQALDFLDTKQTKEDYDTFVQTFKKASRKYVKRQFTWFRREPMFRWLDLDMHDPEVAVEMIRQDYEAGL